MSPLSQQIHKGLSPPCSNKMIILKIFESLWYEERKRERERKKERETVVVWSTVAPFSIKNLAISKYPFSQTEDNAVFFGVCYNQIKIKEEELSWTPTTSNEKMGSEKKREKWFTDDWRREEPDEEPFSKRKLNYFKIPKFTSTNQWIWSILQKPEQQRQSIIKLSLITKKRRKRKREKPEQQGSWGKHHFQSTK